MIVLLSDGRFANVKQVCNCDRCKERKEAEFLIEDGNGNYIDYIKFHEFNDPSVIKHYDPRDLCQLLHDKLMEVKG